MQQLINNKFYIALYNQFLALASALHISQFMVPQNCTKMYNVKYIYKNVWNFRKFYHIFKRNEKSKKKLALMIIFLYL